MGLAATPLPAAPLAAGGDVAAARAQARMAGKLVLLEFGAEWCSGCKLFARDAQSVPEVQRALATVVLLPLDAEQGAAVALAKQFRVHGFPTFVLTDPEGQPVDRWLGYSTPAEFGARLASALADPTTIAAKQARLERAPTAGDAARLASIRVSESDLRAGLTLYRRARALDPQVPGGWAHEIFVAVEMGTLAGVPGFTADSLRAAADLVLAATPRDPADLLHVASTMRIVGSRTRHPELAAPYLAAAVAATAAVTDSVLREQRQALLPDHALFVEKDVRKAARLQRAAMPAGWQDDAARLNEYAWWCFQNDVNLKDAEKLARRGVQLAAPGRDKAMLLDTLAEIRARRGDPREAAVLSELAMREVPNSVYYPRQAARFRQAAGNAQ